MNIEDFKKLIQSLKPCQLDTSKCTTITSFHHQILHNHERRQKSEERQKIQFNLANGRLFSDPIEAAGILLEREYGKTFLFDDRFTDSVFIPPVFVSKLYKSDVSVLEYNVIDGIERARTTLQKNIPGFWFTIELEAFLQKHIGSDITYGNYDTWMVKIKCIHLLREKGPPPIPTIAIPTIDLGPKELLPFAQFCVAYLEQCDRTHHFTRAFKDHANKEKRLRRWLINTLKANPLDHNSPMKWLFKANLLDVSGELPERYLFDELKGILGDEGSITIEKFVILHANDISLRDEKSSHIHVPTQKEFDFLLLSAERKLIIAIEAKRSLPNQPFKQLREYQEIFEEGLGDQLDDEWTFYPALYVHKPHEQLKSMMISNHFIHQETDLEKWFQNVLDENAVKPRKNLVSVEQLKNVLKIIVFTLQMSKSSLEHVDKFIKSEAPVGTVVHSKWSNYIEKAIEAVSTADNIIFYSNDQIPIFLNNDPRNKKVILFGGYGSGKTFLLREKAEMLAVDHNEKVLFIFGIEYMKKTLLQLTLEQKWNDPKYNGNIRVLNTRDIVVRNILFIKVINPIGIKNLHDLYINLTP